MDRVQDYLDDKLQSAADLDSLDALLATVQAQQHQLQHQLEDARRTLDAAVATADGQHATLQAQGRAFAAEQEAIDRRLRIVTLSDASDAAADTFAARMATLRKLDVAAAYVDLLRDVDELRADCQAHVGDDDDDAALMPYQRLQQLAVSLAPLHDAADGAAPHLLHHVQATVADLRAAIQTAGAARLETTLRQMHWPRAVERVPLALEADWERHVRRLLHLQMPELQLRERRGGGNGGGNSGGGGGGGASGDDDDDDPPALLPVELLVRPLELRFHYHFSGNKPTNRLDKPEYFLNHVTDLVATYSDFLQDSLQPILLQHFRRSDLAFTPAYIDAISAFITALLPMVQDKLRHVARQLTSQPNLFSHLVQEVIRFDTIIKDSYSYTPRSPAVQWSGLSHFLLDTCGHFDQWLTFERDFALSRYQAIIDAPDAGELDSDAVSADATKPSKAAVRLNDLLETVTERYRHLSSYSQRIRFLIDIQIHIFDTFHRRLQAALDSYTSMTSTLGRTMANVTKEQLADIQGAKGLDRICRVFGSADYLERAMRDWSDDLFFLELWDEMNSRHKGTDSVRNSVGNLAEIQQKTSSALGAENGGGLEGALFDETASSYHRLRARSENVLRDALKYDVQQALRPYSAVNTWASLSVSTGSSTSAELDPLIRLLADYLAFLRKALGKAPLRRVGRHVCHTIETYVWSYVLQGKSGFSTAGANQLTTDIRAVCNTIDRYLGAGQASFGMSKLLEGVTLLSLPVRGQVQREHPAADDEDADAAWEDTNGDGDDSSSVASGKPISLFQAERLVFQNNEGARHALEQLGLDTLSEQEARTILRQRVEISS